MYHIFFTKDIFNINCYINDIKNLFNYSTNKIDLISNKLRELQNLNDSELLSIEQTILKLSFDNLSIQNYIDIVGMYDRLKRNNIWIIDDISKDNISLKLKSKIMGLDKYIFGYYYIDLINDDFILKNFKSYINSLKKLQNNKDIEYNLSLVLKNEVPKDSSKLKNIFKLLMDKKELFKLIDQNAINGIYSFIFSNKNYIFLNYIDEFIKFLSELEYKTESRMFKYCIERLYKYLKKLDNEDN